jgi:polyphosphate kinase
VEGLGKWEAYTTAITETLERSHTATAPWTVIRADDKYRARLAAIRAVLSRVDYPGKGRVEPPDPAICGGPDIRHG